MKILVQNYSFDASAKQVTFTDYNPIVIERVLLITNITDNVIIYNFADPLKGGTAATNVLTLTYDTATMSDTDKLQIFYDDVATTQPVSGTVTANLGSTDNAVLDTIDSAIDSMSAKFASGTVIGDVNLGATDNAVLDTIDSVLDTINAKLVSGTDIGDVTINNSTGAAAVNIQDGGNTITVDGTVAVTNSDITSCKTALELLDNSVDGNYLNANMNIAGTDVVGGAGVVAAGVQRTTLASDDPAVTSLAALDNAVDGNYLNVNLNLAGTDCPTGNGTAATSLRVSVASDSTGSLAVTQGTAANLKAQVSVASGGIASGGIASGALASGALASGSIASGALAAGSIAVGAITAGDTSIATTEDTARAAGEHLVKIGASRLDTPVANANVGTDGDYTNLTLDNFGKLWVAGSAIEDAAESAGMSVMLGGAIRRDTCASSSGTSGDVSTINTDSVGALWTDPQGNVAHDAADAGNPIKVGGRASTTPVTAVSANDRVDAFFDVQGRQVVTQKALTGTLSNVNGSASNVTLLAANTARLGATIWNDSTAILYVKLGATASATSCTVKLIADAYYEVPFGYYGIIDGIWASATGVARVTEIS